MNLNDDDFPDLDANPTWLTGQADPPLES